MDSSSSKSMPEDTPEAQAAGEVATAVHEVRSRCNVDRLPHNRFFILFIVYAFIDFLGLLFFVSVGLGVWPLIAMWTGTLFAQGVFLAIWASLGPFCLFVRWMRVLLTALVIYFLCCFGLIVDYELPSAWSDFPEMAAYSLVIPLCFLMLQIPLWIRRAISGWQIIPIEEIGLYSPTKARQFGMVHILGLMLVLAVALSLVHVAIINTVSSPEYTALHSREIWSFLGVFGLIGCPYVAVWAGPALRACFLVCDKGAGCGRMALLWLIVSLSIIFIYTIIGLIVAGDPYMPFKIVVSIFLHFAAMVFVLMISLHFLRACGHEMVCVQKKRTRGPLAVADRSMPEGESSFDSLA